MDKTEIYCPQCAWRPRPEDRWACIPACGTVWNTFWTRGQCPGCAHQWHLTQCLACREHFRHRDWYHLPPDAKREQARVAQEVA